MSTKAETLLRNAMAGCSLSDAIEKEKRLDQEYYKDLMWYHGRGANRMKAETLLLAEDSVGVFLVRESYSSLRDLVLSVYEGNKKVGHYKIDKNESGAYFKMDAMKDYVQGLDVLIKHCYGSECGLPCRLVRFVTGQQVPPESMKNGRTNILHLATECGKIDIVKKILKDKNCPNVNYKNNEGSTAIHIASLSGNCAIISLLLKKNASVSIKDMESYTPLQVACKKDANSAAVCLLGTSGASLVARAVGTGLSAMHIAAMNGNRACIQELLALGAPCKPRDSQYHTPYDLAKANKHDSVVQLLDAHVCPSAQTVKEDWFHPQLTRQEAEALLTGPGQCDGLFLVRRSSKKPNNYAISLFYEHLVYHYEVKTLENKIFFIDDSPFMTSIEHLIEHFSKYSDGLCCSLRFALTPDHKQKPVINKKASKKLANSSTPSLAPSQQAMPSAAPPSSPATVRSEHPAMPLPSLPGSVVSTGKQTSGDGMAPDKQKTLPTIPVFAAADVKLQSELGQGEFGSVMKGYVVYQRDSAGNEIKTEPAAVKTLHDEHIQQADFLREAHVMFALTHQNIVRLIGICEGPPVMIIQELVSSGSMLDYLWDYPNKVKMETDLYLWAAQIVCGMMYLENKGFVHRDLAARNILLQGKMLAKISDFGLSRAVNANSDYYKASKGGRWPVKWYAPESINYGNFSHASDVWSYGVTLYEMFSYGNQPYGEMTGSQVLSFIERGGRLEQPARCPEQVYTLMKRCWSAKPAERPTFHDLNQHFETHPAYANTRGKVRQQWSQD